MIRRIQKTCLLALVFLIVMLAMLFEKGIDSAYTIYFVDVQEQEAESPDEVAFLVNGGNLLRVNSFYIDGERVKDCEVERMTYSQCRVVLDRSAFVKGNGWYELHVGYHKWGFIDLLSSPVWINWMGL